MSFLVDTNVISEIRKGPKCDSRVARWYESVDEDELYLSALVPGEIRKGIEKARRQDLAKAQALERWLKDLLLAFEGFILPVDQEVAEEWGRISAGRTLPVVDALMAATAKVYGLTFVTRNVGDIAGTGVHTLDPFAFEDTAEV